MIPGRDLLGLVDAFRGFAYGTISVGYPWPVPGVRLPQTSRGAPRMTNCCCFAESLLARAFNLEEWGPARHSQFMITTADRFGPITAAVSAGIADELAPEEYPGAWRLVQGWRRDGGGHTFIVVETRDDGPLLILEANRAFGVDGVGYRDVGPRWGLGRGVLPEPAHAWDWDRLQRTYPEMSVCALHVEPIE